MYLSHCLHELLQFYRPHLRLGQSERWLFMYFLFKDAFPQRLLPKQSIALVWAGVTSTYSIKRRGVWFRGPPPSASWLWGDPLPQHPPGLCSDGTAELGVGSVSLMYESKGIVSQGLELNVSLHLPKCT